MDSKPITHCICKLDRGEGILLVDIESETIPRRDKNGNPQYYCLTGHHIFSIDRDKQADEEFTGLLGWSTLS